VGRSSGNLLFSFENRDGSAKETTKEKENFLSFFFEILQEKRIQLFCCFQLINMKYFSSSENRSVFHLDDIGFHSDRTFYYSLLQLDLSGTNYLFFFY
jgi:hypothetical protein